MLNVVLVEPQIPPNTGNIGRLCVASGAVLHIIKPMGFSIEDKHLKRAGMDYWYDLDVRYYDNLEVFWAMHPLDNRHFFATTKTQKPYFEVLFASGDFIYFGREDAGLPTKLIDTHPEQCITIPMKSIARSLNLATSVGIVLYEAIRQNYGEFHA